MLKMRKINKQKLIMGFEAGEMIRFNPNISPGRSWVRRALSGSEKSPVG
jgi:hypothetical protein